MGEKNYYSAREATAKTKSVLIILWVLLFATVVTGGVLVWRNIGEINAENTIEKNSAKQIYLKRNVLLCIEDTENETVKPQFLLIGFDGESKMINILELPETMKITASDQSDTMEALYNYGGMKYLSDALANNFTITVDSYIGCTLAQVEAVVDKLGGVDFSVEQKMLQKNADGSLICNLIKGKQKLNGNQVCQFIRFDGWQDNAQKAKKRGELTQALFNEYAPFIDAETMISVYDSVANKLDTNVSVIKMNDFSKAFKVFGASDAPARVAGIQYKNQSYDDVLFRNTFKY